MVERKRKKNKLNKKEAEKKIKERLRALGYLE